MEVVLRRRDDVGVTQTDASRWEPFDESAHHAIRRAQEVAQLFGAASVDTTHVAFALAEGDDELARLLAASLDHDAMRARLGVARGEPNPDMRFSEDTKHAIEAAFGVTRRLHQRLIGRAAVALGLLDLAGAPPLAPGVDRDELRAHLMRLVPGGAT